MSTTRPLILQLLLHDMKHEQLVAGLHRLGFSSELHHTDLSEAVATLMGLTEETTPPQWLDMYMQFLKKARAYSITHNGQNLLPLAETCYALLMEEANKALPAGETMQETERQ